jgi:hypothetical protein
MSVVRDPRSGNLIYNDSWHPSGIEMFLVDAMAIKAGRLGGDAEERPSPGVEAGGDAAVCRGQCLGGEKGL